MASGAAAEQKSPALACPSFAAAGDARATPPREFYRGTSHREAIAEALTAARLWGVALRIAAEPWRRWRFTVAAIQSLRWRRAAIFSHRRPPDGGVAPP